MYNGEVKVRHSNIQTFLALAERFRIRGLCQNDGASGRASPVPATTNNVRRRSEDSSWHQPAASPGPSSRRTSLEETPSKRSRYRGDNESEDELLKPEVSIKEESHRRRPVSKMIWLMPEVTRTARWVIRAQDRTLSTTTAWKGQVAAVGQGYLRHSWVIKIT